MAKKSTAAKPKLSQEQCAPLLGTYTSSTGGTFVATWQDGGFGLYRTPLTGPGQSKHLDCAHAFRRLLSFAAFTLAEVQIEVPVSAPRVPAARLTAAPTPVPAAEPVSLLADYTVLDLEFQGTAILELAAIRFKAGQAVAQLVTFVRFTEEVNYHVTKLTGITARDVRAAPEERQVLQWFRELAGDSLLICHNITADRRVLEATRARLGAAQPLANPWLCTLALSKQRRPGGSHKLGDLCSGLGIPVDGAHRAINDVLMCAKLLQAFHAEQPVGPEALYGAIVAKRPSGRRVAQAGLFSSAA